LGRAANDGAFHLGGGENTEGIDPARECYPSGQGVGAIGTLIPAAALVESIVTQAERVLAGVAQSSANHDGAE
jgi:enoyl-[acyl-carrier protein] reductase II